MKKLTVGDRKRLWSAAWLAVALVVAQPAWGQGGPADTVSVPRSPLAPAVLPEWPKRDLTKITISGQKLAKPDLHYQLTPRLEDTQEGNAAVKYLQAIARLPAVPPGQNETLLSDVARDAALESLDPKDARLTAALAQFNDAFKLLGEGARCDRVDFQVPIRTQGMAAMLPQLSPMRWMANALSVRIRVAIRDHRWSDAQADLQTGYMLARHLNEGDTIIEGLVGFAIATNMNHCVQDWIGEPGAPNLYWPLTNLPTPFGDLRRPMAGERAFIYFSLPEFKRMRAGQFTVDDWDGLVKSISMVAHGGPPVQTGPAWQRQLMGAGAAMALYPLAKEFLVARGESAESVEKMPVAEAVGRYFVQSFDETEDDVFKWMGLPLAQRVAGLKEWEKTLAEDRAANRGNVLAMLLLPSFSRVAESGARLDREIAALRTVEAIRAYAGGHGELPATLDALDLPVPVDPLGKPFSYVRDGDKAVLSSPAQENARDIIKFDLTFRK